MFRGIVDCWRCGQGEPRIAWSYFLYTTYDFHVMHITGFTWEPLWTIMKKVVLRFLKVWKTLAFYWVQWHEELGLRSWDNPQGFCNLRSVVGIKYIWSYLLAFEWLQYTTFYGSSNISLIPMWIGMCPTKVRCPPSVLITFFWQSKAPNFRCPINCELLFHYLS